MTPTLLPLGRGERSGDGARDCVALVYVDGTRAPMSYNVVPPTTDISRFPADFAINEGVFMVNLFTLCVPTIHNRRRGLTKNLINSANASATPPDIRNTPHSGILEKPRTVINNLKV
jgi:hypothetical protein